MGRIVLFLLGITICLEGATVDFLKDRVGTLVSSMEGFCSKEKAENFIDLVIDVEPDLCVEIGVYAGASLFPVAAALKYLGKGTVIGIDAWDVDQAIANLHPVRDKIDYNWWKGVDFEPLMDTYHAMIHRYGLSDYVVTIRAPAKIASFCCSSIDILHIDGNLGETETLKDIAAFLPRVRPGGYIWIGDALKHRRQKPIEEIQLVAELVKSIDQGATLLFRKKGGGN